MNDTAASHHPLRVAMYGPSHDHIGDRLAALGLDLEVLTFDADGAFRIDGALVAPDQVDIDYLWLSTHVAADEARQAAFDLALALRSVDVVQTFNAGLDDPVYAALSAKGVRVCNSSAQGVAIAEYVFAQVMSLTHPVAEQRAMQAAREWRTTPFRELSRTHWLIIGHGPIGQAVVKRARAFEAEVSVIRRAAAPAEGADRTGTLADLPAFLPDADIVLLACPLNAATAGLAGPAFFNAIKPGAIFVNIARGGVVDEAALIAALDAERLETAVLDVVRTEPLPPDDPLWRHPKVRITPHTSFAGDGSRGRWDALFLENIARYANGEALLREVAPEDL
ncbi:MAG: NAD(P)-dependent oxidoreductase [Pseudomonadota bacterium]